MAGFVETLLDNVDKNLDNFVFNTYDSLATELSTTIRLMFILFWVIYGISIMKGLIEFNIRDFANNVFRLTLIFVFITNWDIFNQFVYELFTETPNQIGGKLLAISSDYDKSGVNAALDKILSYSLYASNQLIRESPTFAWGMKISGVIFLVVMIILIAYSAYLIVLSKVAIALLLGLAPIFLLMLVFKKTTGLFEGWLRQVLNFVLIPILTYGMLVLVISIVNSDLKAIEVFIKNEVMPGTTSIYSMVFTAIVSIALMYQITGIASGIAGGVQISGMGDSLKNNAKKWGGRGVQAGVKGYQAMKGRGGSITN